MGIDSIKWISVDPPSSKSTNRCSTPMPFGIALRISYRPSGFPCFGKYGAKPKVELGQYQGSMRLLLSAYACRPNAGSEPGFGWNWATHLADRGIEVHALVAKRNQEPIEAGLRAN